MSEKVHVVFRSAETGRYIFHAMWEKEFVDRIEWTAKYLGQSVEDFIHDAIEAYAKQVLNIYEP